MSAIPDFYGSALVDRSGGFFLESEAPADIANPRYLRGSDPWVALACALTRLQHGHFDVFPAVADWIARYDDLLFFLNAGTLFCHAAPLSEVDLFRQTCPPERLTTFPPERISDYCRVLCHTMSPRYLDEVLYWYRKRGWEGWVRVEVAWWLSHIWEAESGPIEAGPELVLDPQYPPPFEQQMRDYDSYEALVRKHADKAGTASFWIRGEPFSLVGLAQHMLVDSKAGTDTLRTSFERMVFEANTGISCREFFTDGDTARFRPLAAAAILEEFLADPKRERFEDGVRYFFGHRIPD
jgi:hypothetical protein